LIKQQKGFVNKLVEATNFLTEIQQIALVVYHSVIVYFVKKPVAIARRMKSTLGTNYQSKQGCFYN
jgi:hypothetical protein